MISGSKRNVSRMLVVILALLVVAGMLVPAMGVTGNRISGADVAKADDQTVYHDGTYEGTAEGYKSDITVAVTISEGRITKIEAISQQETKSYWKKLINAGFFESFAEKQTADVDTVSGATISSSGVINAVKAALELAKADPDSPFSQGEGTKASPFVINSASKLEQFAKSVDEGESYAGKYIALGNDIDISEISNWDPIGDEKKNSANIFAGNFDGEGFTVKGLTIKGKFTSDMNTGLFSALAQGAGISDLKLKNASICVGGSADMDAGILAGTANGSIVTNISVEGSVSAQTSSNSKLNAGGILGTASDTIICNNSSNAEIFALAKGSKAAAFAGSIAGQADRAANNASFGEVYASAPQCVNGGCAGGILGKANGILWNDYSTADIAAGGIDSANAGAAAGKTEGADLVCNYYAKDASLVVEKNDTSQTIQAGSEINTESDKAAMVTSDFADTMTDNLVDLVKRAKEKGITDLLVNEWKIADGKVVPSGDIWTAQAAAEEGNETFAAGKGTKKNPFIIETKDQLRSFAGTVNAGDTYSRKYVRLDSDIDMTGEKWEPAGFPDKAFKGTFDGNGKTIKNLSIGTKEEPLALGTVKATDAEGKEVTQTRNVAGFFTRLETGAVVKNLKMEKCGFYGNSNGGAQTGLLAGYSGSGVIIDNCEASGVSEVTNSKGNAFHGGLVGRLEGSAMINCISDIDVECENTAAYPEAGGLVGMNNGGLIANSCMLGDVTAKTGSQNSGYTLAGLIAGYHQGDIVNCYSCGNLETNDESQFSGLLVGWVRGYARTYLCKYSDTSTLTMAGKKMDPVKTIGVSPAAMPDSEGKVYLGGLTDRVSKYDHSKPEELVESLNGEFSKFPVDITEYGVEKNALRGWDIDDNDCVVFGEDNASVRYEVPECEVIPQKEKSLNAGTWYGRSKDKSSIVSIVVTAGKIKNVTIIKGDTQGEAYEEALEKAKEKSIYGDTSSYDKADPGMFGGGSGTEKDPYLIRNEAQLRYLASSINEDVDWKGKYFKQTADITLENGDWTSIGWGIVAEVKAKVAIYAQYPFRGSYDGSGKAIRKLKIGSKNEPSVDPRVSLGAGLFGYTEGEEETNDTPQDPGTRYVELKNIRLADADINIKTPYDTYAGALAGISENGIRITDCYAGGNVRVKAGSGTTYAGGLAGLTLRGLICNCVADVNVDADADDATVYAGGMYGNDNRSTTVNSHSLGNVRANSGNGTVYAGGMSGMFAGIRYNCYTRGDVVSTPDTQYAGLVNGQHAGIGGESSVYYNSDAKLSAGRKDVEKKANGYSAGRDEQSVLTARTASQMSSADFAKTLNSNQAKAKEVLAAMHVMVKDINHHGHGMYYAGDGSDLAKWAVEKNIVTLSGMIPAAVSPGKPYEDHKPDKEKVVKGKTYTVAGAAYKTEIVAAGKGKGTFAFTKAKNTMNVTVPAKVRFADGKVYKVDTIAAKAFTGKKIKKVIIGANVKTIRKNAFAKSNAKMMIIRSKLLTKRSVKGSLKNSKISMVKVKVGKSKLNKQYVKKYKKIFTKKNAGKKVKVI